jgi:ketosteroid isomerase-like protein
VYSRWRLSGGADPDGKPVDITGATTDVVRQDGEGAWRFAIDNPWGTAAAG